jgi:hemolysin III
MLNTESFDVDAEEIASAFAQERVLEGDRARPAYRLWAEIASAITHGLGALMGIVALALLIPRAAGFSDGIAVASVSIYGSSLVLLYLMSTLYHALPVSKAKRVFKVLDHASIYVLIAGTYTAYAPGIIRGGAGWSLFGILWGCAAAGVSLEAFWVNRPKALSAILYVAMGWIVVFLIGPVRAALGTASFVCLVSGGIAYTLGAVIYTLKRLSWSHPLFHVFVLAGSIFHFASVWMAL